MDGHKLKRLRKEKKLTQTELGKIINVTKVSISGYENGERSPDAENLRRLAEYFDVSSDYLLGISDDPKGYSTEEEKHYAKGGFLDMDDEEREKVEEYLEFLRSQKKKHDDMHKKD